MISRWSSPHLHLRYLERDDLPAIVAMLAKETVCEHLFFGPNSEEETLGYFTPLVEAIEAALDADERPLAPVFSLVHPRSSEFMGTCALIPVEFSPGNSLIGFQLDEPYWRQGFGTWAGRFLVQHGFLDLGLRRITGDCFATNIGSAMIMRGLGFSDEGVQRGHYLHGGEPVDNLLFGLLRSDIESGLLEKWSNWT